MKEGQSETEEERERLLKIIILTTVRMSTETDRRCGCRVHLLHSRPVTQAAEHCNNSFSISSEPHSAAPQPALYMYENQQAA